MGISPRFLQGDPLSKRETQFETLFATTLSADNGAGARLLGRQSLASERPGQGNGDHAVCRLGICSCR
jgi:hypothetical protein